MTILPLIDLLILAGTVSLTLGAFLKAVYMTTAYRPTILTLSAVDFAIIAAVCFGLSVTLAVRTWVKLNDPQVVALRRERAEASGVRRAREIEAREAEQKGEEAPAVAGARERS